MGSTASSIAGRPEETWQWTAVLVSNLISFIVGEHLHRRRTTIVASYAGTFIWWTSLRKLIPFHPLYRSMGTAFAWVADVWRLPGYADSLRLSVGRLLLQFQSSRYVENPSTKHLPIGTTEFVAGALCMACGWIGGSLSEALVMMIVVSFVSWISRVIRCCRASSPSCRLCQQLA